MNTTQTTNAQKIATRFGDDGQCWTDANGVELETTLDVKWNAGVPRRCQFPDGSALILTEGAWDHGITDDPDPDAVDRRKCVCWSEDGETCREPDNCPCECSRHHA